MDAASTIPAPLKRRWFQFTLRTLLIGVALLALPCAHVAHEAQIVRERSAFTNAHEKSYFFLGPSPSTGATSWLRRQLGDRGYYSVCLPLNATKEERAKAAVLFPEAAILAINPNYDLTRHDVQFVQPFFDFPDEPAKVSPR